MTAPKNKKTASRPAAKKHAKGPADPAALFTKELELIEAEIRAAGEDDVSDELENKLEDLENRLKQKKDEIPATAYDRLMDRIDELE